MGLSSGFYNSLNGDRKYNVDQITMLLGSIIKDGVFQGVGNAFNVTVNTGSEIFIDEGYAWFNKRWILNDSLYPLDLGISELLLDRIDAVVIEIDETESVRTGTIKQVKGVPSATPVKPVLVNADFIHQYPLAYILRPANNNEILTSNIELRIGMSDCPFVIGVQETLDIDMLFAQWNAQWNEYTTDSALQFDTWFDRMKGQLTTDAAGNLQTQINSLTVNVADKLSSTSDTKDNVTTFTSASVVENILTGETHSTIFGKIKAFMTRVLMVITTKSISLGITGWTAESGGYYKAVTLTGLLVTDKPHWSMRSATNYPTAAEEANYALLKSVTCTADTLTFHATATPSAALTIEVRL